VGEILGHVFGFRKKWVWSSGWALDIGRAGEGGSFVETGLWVSLKVTCLDK